MDFKSVLTMIPIVFWSLSTASAEPVSVAFSGVIYQVTDPKLELPAGVALNAPFSGSFTLDPTQIISVPYSAPLIWDHEGPGVHPLMMTVAGHAFTTPIDVVRIGNGVSGLGDLWLLANSNLLAFPNGTLYVSLSMQDTTATRINDASIFFVNTSLAGWDTPDIGILIADYAATPTPRRLLARGRMTSIPEPDLAIGIACAAMLLGAAGRLRARRAHA